jgi:hypothetical protein
MDLPKVTGLASIAEGDPTKAAVDSAFFKIVNVVEVDAPLKWVWDNWTLNFDVTKIMTNDPTGKNPTMGTIAQRTGPARDGTPFNEKGSHIYYATVQGGVLDEVVLQRDHEKLIYEYEFSIGFAFPTGHKVYQSTGPKSSRIIWTYWVRPASDDMKARAHEYLKKVWGPFLVNHSVPNLKKAIEGLYAGDESYRAK